MSNEYHNYTREQLVEELETLQLQVYTLSVNDTPITKDVMVLHKLIELQQLIIDLCGVIASNGMITDIETLRTIMVSANTSIVQMNHMLRGGV